MSYDRLNLPNGILLTAEHIKHLENGIAAAHNITLGLNDSGDRIYLYMDGKPVDNGISLPSGGASGDVVGYVDSNNNDIVLNGKLEDGSYVLKYVDASGVTTYIGTLTIGDTKYTNFAAPTSADWLYDQRINSSGNLTSATSNPGICYTTNFIPLKAGDTVRVKGLDIRYYDTGAAHASLTFYNTTKSKVCHITPAEDNKVVVDAANALTTYTVSNDLSNANSISYARFVGMLFDGYTVDDIIITVNQEITD